MKFKTLEALRGVAALLVVVHHVPLAVTAPSNFVENGSLFVDFFFVLSGFVMTFAYARKIGDGLPFRDFAVLRLGRLFPLHAFMMLAWGGLILAMAVAGELSDDLASQITGESFVLNLALINSFGLEEGLRWNYPSWSISAELFAYSLFFVAVASLKTRLTGAFAACISMTAYTFLLSREGSTIQWTYDLGFIRCFGGFFLGVATFRLHESLGQQALNVGTTAEIAVIALATILLMQSPGFAPFEVLSLLSFCGVVLVFANSSGLVSNILSHGAPVFVGRISYSIYLVHGIVVFLLTEAIARWGGELPILVVTHGTASRVVAQTDHAFIATLAVLAVVIALSTLLYRWIEEPFTLATRRMLGTSGSRAQGRSWTQRLSRG